MKYFRIEPSAPGVVGENARWDTSSIPPKISNAEIEIMAWQGDDLIECYPLYAVTPRLAAALREADLTGFQLTRLTTRLAAAGSFNSAQEIPAFERLVVTGMASEDDAGFSDGADLIVSRSFLEVLRRFSLTDCEVVSVG